MIGKIEKALPSLYAPDNRIYEVVQVRENTIISYSKNVEFKSSGNIETLRQSIKTPVDVVLEDLYNESGVIDFDKWIADYQFYNDWRNKYIPFAVKELGTVSKNTAKRMCKLIENAVNGVYAGYDWKKDYKDQPYITFLTTTLPAKQMHTDKVIKRAFTVFLENLVKTYGVKFYLWKAEAQKNGNIHFHVLIDRYVEHTTVRRLWNSQMKSLGYINQYAKNMIEKGFVYNPHSKKSREIQHLDYILNKKEGFKNPNTTDIHSLKGIKNVASYMIKYLTKNEPDKRPIIGRLWGCSRNIKFLKYAEFVGNYLTSQIVDVAEKHLKRIDGIDFVNMYKGQVKPVLKRYLLPIYDKLKEHYLTIHQKLYEPESIESKGCDETAGSIGIDCTQNFKGYQIALQF